jgi:hypothetical protein
MTSETNRATSLYENGILSGVYITFWGGPYHWAELWRWRCKEYQSSLERDLLPLHATYLDGEGFPTLEMSYSTSSPNVMHRR